MTFQFLCHAPPVATVIGEVGALLAGVSGLIAGIIATYNIISKKLKARADALIEATTASVQAQIARNILSEVSDRDPTDYYTLDMRYPDGSFMIVPMIPWVPLMLLENIRIGVIDIHSDTTTLLLVCDGFGHIKSHFHEHTTEEIKILRGVMTCIETGTIYRTNDVWSCKPGEVHGATFQDCVAMITHRPALPLASQQPVDVSQMRKVYPQPRQFPRIR